MGALVRSTDETWLTADGRFMFTRGWPPDPTHWAVTAVDRSALQWLQDQQLDVARFRTLRDAREILHAHRDVTPPPPAADGEPVTWKRGRCATATRVSRCGRFTVRKCSGGGWYLSDIPAVFLHDRWCASLTDASLTAARVIGEQQMTWSASKLAMTARRRNDAESS